MKSFLKRSLLWSYKPLWLTSKLVVYGDRVNLIEEPIRERESVVVTQRSGKSAPFTYQVSPLIEIFQRLLPGHFSRIRGDYIDIFPINKKVSYFYFLNVNIPSLQIIDEYCEEQKIKTLYERIPDRVMYLLREGICTLVLDAAGEGHRFFDSHGIAFHKLVDEIGCPAKHIIYACQNHLYQKKYNDWCDCHGIPIDKRIKCVTCHSFFLKLVISNGLNKEQIPELSSDVLLKKYRTKKWLCMNYKAKIHRILLFYNMFKNNFLEEGYFSLNEKFHPNVFESIDKVKKFFPSESNESVYGVISDINQCLPIHLDINSKGIKNHILEVNKRFYGDSYFSIVTESDFSTVDSDIKRFTEKSLKPILGLHPFVIFGNPGTLELLRNLGFKTFDGIFIDESYDHVSDPYDRFCLAFEQLERLCSLTSSELHRLYGDLVETLIHNYNHFTNYMPDWCRRQIYADFLSDSSELN